MKTIDYLAAWVLEVAGIEPGSPRFWPYVSGWNVIEKIQAEKIAAEPATAARLARAMRPASAAPRSGRRRGAAA